MARIVPWSRGGRIVAVCFAVGAVYATLPVLGARDVGEALAESVRRSARAAGIVFLAAYVARPLVSTRARDLGRALVRVRRYVGFAAGALHLFHAALIGTRGIVTSGASLAGAQVPSVVGGALVYGVMVAMMVTSFDGPAARLGRAHWRRLHALGAHTLFALFFLAFASRLASDLAYAPLVVAYALALALRIRVRFRSRRAAGE